MSAVMARRPQRLPSRTGNDGFRHQKGCVWSGQTLVRHTLADPNCVCDPHGTKARAMRRALDRYERRNVLGQSKIWYPKNGDPVRLKDMSLRWKVNLLGFLERRAEALHMSACGNAMIAAGTHDGGEMAQDALDWIADEIIEQEPLEWLNEQPLVVRLRKLIARGQDGPVDR